MNEWMVIALALFLCGTACGIGAAIAFAQGKSFKRQARQTRAVIADVLPLGKHGQPAIHVRFTDHRGRTICARAQRYGTRGLRAGDEVTIAYTQRKALGLELWNIVVLKNQAAKPFLRYTGAGVVLAVIATLLLGAGVIVLY